MSRVERIVWGLAALLAVATLAVVVWRFWPLLFPEVAQVAEPASDCELRSGPCEVVFADGERVRFAIEPRQIPVLRPLQLRVELQGLAADRVMVDFSGVDMNMGFNRPQLQQRSPGLFEGRGSLPVCVRDAMEWEARVLLETDDGLLAAPFRFWTYKPGQEPN